MERKSSFRRSWGRLLRFLGVSEGCCFSMRFLISKKSVQNREIPDNWRPEGTRTVKMKSPGGMRGATGEDFRRGQRSLHEFCMQCEAEFNRMLTCIRHALPGLEARGGGSLTRIPPGQDFETIVCWVVGCWSVGVGVCVCECECVYVFFDRVGPKGITKQAGWINC